MEPARGVLAAAAAQAPDEPGVYLLVDDTDRVLYVGKATSLRQRLAQHRDQPSTSHLHRRYELTRSVRWAPAPDPRAAAWREADLIFALRPSYNAETGARSRRDRTGVDRTPYLAVEPAGDDRLTFRLVHGDVETSAGTEVYGCFPHLGKGTSTDIGTTCSDGYAAFLRLVWAGVGAGSHVPAALTRSAPDRCTLSVPPDRRRRLHSFLSGVSDRLVGDLVDGAERRDDPVVAHAARRDALAALGLFAAGPRRLRTIRLGHGLPPGPVAPDRLRELLVADLEADVGPLDTTGPSRGTA